MSRDHFWLTDRQFARIAPHLPTDTRDKPRVDDRRVISGIVQVLKSGARWVDAPSVYGPRKTLYNRYVRWAAKSVPPNSQRRDEFQHCGVYFETPAAVSLATSYSAIGSR